MSSFLSIFIAFIFFQINFQNLAHAETCIESLAELVIESAHKNKNLDLEEGLRIQRYIDAKHSLNNLYRAEASDFNNTLHTSARAKIEKYSNRESTLKNLQDELSQIQGKIRDQEQELILLRTKHPELNQDGYQYFTLYDFNRKSLGKPKDLPEQSWEEFERLIKERHLQNTNLRLKERDIEELKALEEPSSKDIAFSQISPEANEDALVYLTRVKNKWDELNNGTNDNFPYIHSPNYFFKSLELNEDSKNLLTSEVAVKLPHRYQRLLKDLSEGRNAAREGLISELNSKLKASEKLLVDLESRIKNFDQKNPAILALKKEIEDLKKFASNNDFDTWFMGGVTSVGILLLYEWFVDDSKVDKKIEELQNKIKELEKEKEIRH